MRSLARLISLCAGALILLGAPVVAAAHAFGVQYTLPVPLSYYAISAALTLVASFAALFLIREPRAHSGPRVVATVSRGAYRALRALGVAVLVATIALGLFGPQTPAQSLVPIAFWIFLTLGIAYASVFLDGLWRALNPFETIVRAIVGNEYVPLFEYPRCVGIYPALATYAGLIWLELLSFGIGTQPQVIALVLLGYLGVTLLGAVLYGADAWFERAELTNVLFGLFGRAAPLSLRTDGRVESFRPAERLVTEAPMQRGTLLFVLFMLSSTAFDSLRETQLWADVFFRAPIVTHYELFSNFALLLSPLVFFACYALVLECMRRIVSEPRSLGYLLGRFAYSLIPIAIAYSFAHYFMLLLVGGHDALVLLSDPLVRGWDLFGTAAWPPPIGLIGAKAIWNIQLGAILVGHIIATYVAHRIALREFRGTRDLFFGQLPMLALMVAYTVFGLWLLSLSYAAPQ